RKQGAGQDKEREKSEPSKPSKKYKPGARQRRRHEVTRVESASGCFEIDFPRRPVLPKRLY
ncbi:MAG: hypothetical protein ACRD4F_04625, partial [Candidatus Angelobacter sp.]